MEFEGRLALQALGVADLSHASECIRRAMAQVNRERWYCTRRRPLTTSPNKLGFNSLRYGGQNAFDPGVVGRQSMIRTIQVLALSAALMVGGATVASAQRGGGGGQRGSSGGGARSNGGGYSNGGAGARSYGGGSYSNGGRQFQGNQNYSRGYSGGGNAYRGDSRSYGGNAYRGDGGSYGGTHKEWEIQQGDSYVIGSQNQDFSVSRYRPDIDIFIPDAAIAARHAILFGKEGRFYMARHPSSTDQAALARFPLRVRGKTVVTSLELRDSDDVMVGRTALKFVTKRES
jgi:hypothetical protein